MTQNLLQQLLAVSSEVDGPEGWIHLCITAANEAQAAVNEECKVLLPRYVADYLNRYKERNNEHDLAPVLKVAEAYASGYLIAPSGGSNAAAFAYRNTLPPIANRRSVQAFVACVATGVLRGYIDVKDANSLLYAAQAALTAFPKRKPRKGGKV